jgi:hypothetical protein
VGAMTSKRAVPVVLTGAETMHRGLECHQELRLLVPSGIGINVALGGPKQVRGAGIIPAVSNGG